MIKAWEYDSREFILLRELSVPGIGTVSLLREIRDGRPADYFVVPEMDKPAYSGEGARDAIQVMLRDYNHGKEGTEEQIRWLRSVAI